MTNLAVRTQVVAAGISVAALFLATPAFTADAEFHQGGTSKCAQQFPQHIARGIEGQRKADLGNGRFQNPVLAGDHPDPSVLKDGKTYYKVSSSFNYYPGLVIWRSTDLVNWTPIGPALRKPVGSVFAPDLVKHNGRYFIYFPAANLPKGGVRPYGNRPPLATFVIHADSVEGPWSDPIDLRIFAIDPGHAVGEDGKRYLFVDGGRRIKLRDDGLATDGKLEKVYDGWPIPADWVIEGFGLEGPKILRHNGWFYMFSAQGGTAGPPTGHMVVVARSRSIDGPWGNSPHNPVVRTWSACEPWWSRGHATPVEGPGGDWWLVYHGYENGFRTLGRQMLLEPMSWTKDGWPVARGGDLAAALRKPRGGQAGPHGTALSDDFTHERFGVGLSFFTPDADYLSRASIKDGALRLQATGAKPHDGTILLMNVGDRSYSVTVDVELEDGVNAGLLLFYDKALYAGLSSDLRKLHAYKAGQEDAYVPIGPAIGKQFKIRLVNENNVVRFLLSSNGAEWRLIRSFEVSGYNHNVADGFLSLRPAIFASGKGAATFRSLRYVVNPK